jgi:G protein-coupled receptor 139
MNRFLCEPNSTVYDNSTVSQFSQKLVLTSVYILPVLALAGNSLILVVILNNAQFNRSSFSVYVKSMAISDTFVLIFKLASYLNKESKKYFPSLCTILPFCSEASVLLSVWIIVTITIERTLVVLFPLHKNKFVSTYRARFTVMIIGIVTIIFSIRLLIIPIDTTIQQTKRCHPTSQQWISYRRVNKIITEFAYCYIPLAIVIIGNLLTVCTVKRAVIRRHDMLTNNSYQQKRQSDSSENQLMLMLLIVTLMFIVYFVPYTITSVISRKGLPFHRCFTTEGIKIFFLIHRLSELLKDLNFCTNFIIYCISGGRFRRALIMFLKNVYRRSPLNSQSFENNRNRSDYLLKKYSERRTIHLSAKNTIEESQF